jgi:hypothetical protein
MKSRYRFLSSEVSFSAPFSVDPTVATAKPKPLPGVTAPDLPINLENRRWKGSKPEKANANSTTFNCSSNDKTASVVVWAPIHVT